MPNFKAKVQVSLRPSVLDPAGEAAKSAAIKLGVKGISKVRIGKAIDIEIEAPNKQDAIEQVEILSDRLLSNPVIENWSLQLDSAYSSNHD
ncbi:MULTISPECIES: phosphoribosylformylglycinamidine synthase subunit PurS [Prochlorococcus]|uniref:Phosphoribosylformylglycinamidine synthase subunit PurS n=1 Tax=Prochlorococcus marinus (strain SARG / CCMP1375 / SS120) TaxID=167539 RepID=Q7VC89_PROMA|nr:MULTISPECIES: phosphoribosylformylglycinamidine synthase subunit PurS [Prochlorococcus]AAP99897.1 Phosphoribosylformylglycinamidine (FGAM) synthase, PurS component [Prochlorococcus marinus subsp. marinus str. CCMP1375]KGG11755.1 Phosphoribosylformylglycinamidine synthase [Prochlorococcus marinus str. LG]KGG18831.1 Phosphoribosylformylglycinamidine synthase [Prochlorococcus marinus str. SS2]KGG23631.1 Phosphoribosylformylglycinamidine synthase [Prochlorococcus marinus str. SS35]KGG32133.1 Ph